MARTLAIVGAGPGVGQAIAERFGAEGFRVALISRDAGKLETLVRTLGEKGVEAAAFPADVLDRPGLVRALEAAAARFGGIEVLEYGPSPAPSSLRPPRAIDVENEQYQLDFSVLGAIAAVRAVLPAMLERKAGALLFTTAASAQHPVTFTASFGVAAGAALNYARVLYQDLKADGIYAGIVSIAGLVVQRGQEGGRSPTGLPLVAAQDVADAHWRLFNARDAAEAVVGDLSAIAGVSALR